MKFSKFCLLPILALTLIACGDTPTPSVPATSEPPVPSQTSEQPSETPTEVPSEDVPSEPTTGTPTEVPGTTTTEEVVSAWNADEVALMEGYLNGHTLPYFNVPGGLWVESQGSLVYAADPATVADCKGIVDIFVANEWVDITEPEDEAEQTWYVALPLPLFETQQEMLQTVVILDGTMLVVIPMYIINPWEEAVINQAFSEALGIPVTLPVCSYPVNGLDMISIPLFDNTPRPVLVLMAGSEAEINAIGQYYTADLVEAGYQQMATSIPGFESVMVDPTNTYQVLFFSLTDESGEPAALGISVVTTAEYPVSDIPTPPAP